MFLGQFGAFLICSYFSCDNYVGPGNDNCVFDGGLLETYAYAALLFLSFNLSSVLSVMLLGLFKSINKYMLSPFKTVYF